MSTERVINFLDQFAGDVINHKDDILVASAVLGLADGRTLSLVFGDLDLNQAAVGALWMRVERLRKARQGIEGSVNEGSAGVISENLLQEAVEKANPTPSHCIDPDCEITFGHRGEHRDYTGRSWA